LSDKKTGSQSYAKLIKYSDHKIYDQEVKMKRYFLSVLTILVALSFFGCEVVVAPPRGRVVVAPVPPPPVVVLTARPRLVFVSEYNIYVAPDVDYYLFYDGTFWFYFVDGRWYRGNEYNGPWGVVEKKLPPGLVKIPPGQLKKQAFKEKGFEDHSNGKKGRGRGHMD
jgi:hypothetical protein